MWVFFCILSSARGVKTKNKVGGGGLSPEMMLNISSRSHTMLWKGLASSFFEQDGCQEVYSKGPEACEEYPDPSPSKTCPEECQKFFDDMSKSCKKCDKMEDPPFNVFRTHLIWSKYHKVYPTCKFSYEPSTCHRAFDAFDDSTLFKGACDKEINQKSCSKTCADLIANVNKECAGGKATWVPWAGYGHETDEERDFDASVFRVFNVAVMIGEPCMKEFGDFKAKFPIAEGAWDGDPAKMPFTCHGNEGKNDGKGKKDGKNKDSHSAHAGPSLLSIAIMGFGTYATQQ